MIRSYKKLAVAFLLSLSVLNFASAALTDQLAGYWKQDESSGNPVDSSGNGFTLTNTNTVGFSPALINNGGDFGTGNTNKRFQIANDLGTDGGAISICTWLKMNAEIAAGTQILFLHGGATSHVNDMVSYDYNGGTRQLTLNRQQQNTANNTASGGATLGTSNFNQVCYTYDTVTVKLYLNGNSTPIASLATSGNGASGTSDKFWIANDNGEWLNTFLSAITDETGVWTRALTTTEISQLYNGGAGLTYPFTSSATTPSTMGWFRRFHYR